MIGLSWYIKKLVTGECDMFISSLEFMYIVVAYANLFNVSINDILLPDGINSPTIAKIKLTSTLQSIQLKWLEQTTGRIWDGGEFHELYWQVESWIDSQPESCPDQVNYIVWQGQMWKRGAEYLLGLRLIGE